MRKYFISCTTEGMTDLEQHKAMQAMQYQLELHLSSAKVQQVEGFYMGHKEISFMVTTESHGALQRLTTLAQHFGQDTIMMVSSYGGASIVPMNGVDPWEFLGEFTTTTTKPHGGDYSYNPRANEFYMTAEIN